MVIWSVKVTKGGELIQGSVGGAGVCMGPPGKYMGIKFSFVHSVVCLMTGP
jgi:hypothetical protein